MEIITKFECLQAVSTYIFLLLMVLAFMKLLLFKDDNEKSLQKIIGGLAVFVIAIISKNGWVFSVSLFIGGLIIASEEFMQKLAIILRSNSEDIGQNLKTEPASQVEIEEKQEEESAESIKCENGEIDRRKQFIEDKNKIKIAEHKVLEFLSKDYGIYFKSGVKIETEHGSLIADGIIYDSPANKTISRIVEIKYIRSERLDQMAIFHIRRILEKIRFLLLDIPVLIVLISENITESEASKISGEVKKFGNVLIRCINIHDNGNKIEFIS